MTRHVLLLGLATTISACGGEGTLAPEALCVAVVNVHGVYYVTSPIVAAPADISSEPYVEITRNTGCLDRGEPADELAHGESNFLPAGTTLHGIEGYEPTEALAFWADLIAEWQVVSPMPY